MGAELLLLKIYTDCSTRGRYLQHLRNHDAAKEEATTFVGGIEPRSGQGEGSRCEGSQQVDVERLERNSFTVEGIDPEKFDTLATKNFSSWEDVRTTLGVLPEVIVRLQDMLADHPEVKGWVEKPGDLAESSTPEVSPPESAAKSNISKRHAAQGLSDDVLERHKDKRHASCEAMREVKVRKSHARAHMHLRFAFHSFV